LFNYINTNPFFYSCEKISTQTAYAKASEAPFNESTDRTIARDKISIFPLFSRISRRQTFIRVTKFIWNYSVSHVWS